MEKITEIRELVQKLNAAAQVYYQGTDEIMSNFEYDEMYQRLVALEHETGTILSQSPTQRVGYEVISSLPKEAHNRPMLSLEKTKDVEALASWLGSHAGVLSWKLDGLTVVLTYENGKLLKALTRGNGTVGEVITGNARAFMNVPLSIPCHERVVVRGEAIITYSDFERINMELAEGEEHYKNPRNLCSGSVRQLDSSVTAKRNVRFIAFGMVEGPEFKFRNEELDWLETQGFETVERVSVIGDTVADAVKTFEKKVSESDFPSDGLVLIIDDIQYGISLGRTAKFPRDAMAFKWQDQNAETTLRDVLWSASRTGLINPIAIFDSVELEGTVVSRASLHNVSIMEDLKLGIGDRISVYKANMIIPQVSHNLTGSATVKAPHHCPVCDMATTLKDDGGVKTLHCSNPACPAKEIKRFTLMVGRNALDIEGLSEATLEKFVDEGLIKEPADVFHLKERKDDIISMEGFGEKSFDNLIEAIEKARHTTAECLLYAVGVPGIGVATAKVIARACQGEWQRIVALKEDALIAIEGIGEVLATGFVNFFGDSKLYGEVERLRLELELDEGITLTETYFEGTTFVITGSLEEFSNRDELKGIIENAGGKVSGSVSGKTSYLINNNVESTSGKNRKARELGIPIIDEATVMSWIKNKSII